MSTLEYDNHLQTKGSDHESTLAIRHELERLEDSLRILHNKRYLSLRMSLHLQLYIGTVLLGASLYFSIIQHVRLYDTATLPSFIVKLAAFLSVLIIYWLYLTYNKLKVLNAKIRRANEVDYKARLLRDRAKRLLEESNA